MRRRLVMIIPGNPGDVIFLRSLVDGLRAEGHEVVCWDHPGWLNPPDSLLPYAQHHATQLQAYLDARGDDAPDELVLVGYSLGAYLAYLIVAHELMAFDRVCFLFPFIMQPRPAGMRYLERCANPRWYRSVISAFRRLPDAAGRDLIARAGAAEFTDWLCSVLRSARAHTYFFLAEIELREIASRRSCEYLLAHDIFCDPTRFRCLVTADDRWVPEAVGETLAATTRCFETPVPHDFGLDPDTRGDVLEVMLKVLDEL